MSWLRHAHVPRLLELVAMAVFFSLFLWMLMGCTGNIRPEEIVQTRTVTTEVKVPVPVACVERADVPALPDATAVDIDAAKTDQKAAATAADAEQFERYAKQAAKLLEQCVKQGGGK